MHSIGIYNEKALHSEIKNLLEPDRSRQEVKAGRYIADIFNENGIFEVQTRSFYRIRKKLDYFLPRHKVTLVYPAIREKRIFWTDKDTGETTGGRKSPKSWGKQDVFNELYGIRDILRHENLKIKIVLTDVNEYRRLDGWSLDKKRGAGSIERIPVSFREFIDIESPGDYAKLMPDSLGMEFTSVDYALYSRLSKKISTRAVAVMREAGFISKIGKTKRAVLYRRLY